MLGLFPTVVSVIYKMMITKTIKKCLECSLEFETNRSNKKYCSSLCQEKHKRKNVAGKQWAKLVNNKPCLLNCNNCGEQFRAPRPNYKYCSSKCMKESLSKKLTKFLNIPDCLENASRKLDRNIGYVRVYVPMHPEANSWGYVYEHRVVAEQMIGRRLLPDEIVHHKNGKRWDNRKENLEVMNKFDHGKLHGQREEDLNI